MGTRSDAPVLVFDVNETLLDIAALEPVFTEVFGDPGAMREWFAQLILYSEALTLSGGYIPFNQLGAGVLRMLGETRGVEVAEADVEALGAAMAVLPALPDVEPGLLALSEAGYRLVTLTNSPPGAGPSPLEQAGIHGYFERSFSVDAVQRYKPHPATYAQVSDALGVSPDSLCMVACHVWDTLGAQAVGWTGILIRRPGNAPLPASGVAQPNLSVGDMPDLVQAVRQRWG